MSLQTPEAIKEASDLLESAQTILDQYYKANPITLNFTRVQHFDNRVLWVDADEDDDKLRLKRFIYDLQCHFHKITKEKPTSRFIPHLTVLKGRQKADLIPVGLPERFGTFNCGKAEFASVHLYRMMQPHEPDGGYGCIKSIHVGGVTPPNPVLITVAGIAALTADDSDDDN